MHQQVLSKVKTEVAAPAPTLEARTLAVGPGPGSLDSE